MPRITIVIGANGAGKSTWARRNLALLPDSFYNADAIADGLGGWNSSARQLEARRLVDSRVTGHLKRGEDFGFESTYSGNSRPTLIETAARRGYEIDAVFIGTVTAEINIQRVKKRVAAQTGHHVPREEIVRRWFAARRNLARTAASISWIALVDNSVQTALVALLATDGTTPLARTGPKWATRLTADILENNPNLRGPQAPDGAKR